jgi:tetrahydromethanopterin S-methyltransferase subunit E
MKFVIGFFRFWYDFIVGDDWRIALMVVISLTVGAVLISNETLDPGVIAIVCGVLIAAGLIASLARERRKIRGREPATRINPDV